MLSFQWLFQGSRLFLDPGSFTPFHSLLAWNIVKRSIRGFDSLWHLEILSESSKHLRVNGGRQILAQLAEKDGVDVGHLLALAWHVLCVHLAVWNALLTWISASKLCNLLKHSLGRKQCENAQTQCNIALFKEASNKRTPTNLLRPTITRYLHQENQQCISTPSPSFNSDPHFSPV